MIDEAISILCPLDSGEHAWRNDPMILFFYYGASILSIYLVPTPLPGVTKKPTPLLHSSHLPRYLLIGDTCMYGTGSTVQSPIPRLIVINLSRYSRYCSDD